MRRFAIRVTVLTILFTVSVFNTAQAKKRLVRVRRIPRSNQTNTAHTIPTRIVRVQHTPQNPALPQAQPQVTVPGMLYGYPKLNAPLYPTPQPGVPYQTGGVAITNQAFSPHEMLHPHEYTAVYPPFYHQVSGSWFVTPWGVRSRERWKLLGTKVNVKYRSSYAPFSMFTPPFSR